LLIKIRGGERSLGRVSQFSRTKMPVYLIRLLFFVGISFTMWMNVLHFYKVILTSSLTYDVNGEPNINYLHVFHLYQFSSVFWAISSFVLFAFDCLLNCLDKTHRVIHSLASIWTLKMRITSTFFCFNPNKFYFPNSFENLSVLFKPSCQI